MSKEGANERISRRDAMPAAEKKSHMGIVIVVAVLAICLLGGGIVYLLFGKKEQKSYNTVITSDNVEEIIAQMEEKDFTPIGSYEVQMNTKWEFPDGSSPSSNARVTNQVKNNTTVFFTITLGNDNRQIYKSPYMEPGSRLENIKLDDVLDAGTYETVLTYHLVDDDYKETSKVSVKVILTIHN